MMGKNPNSRNPISDGIKEEEGEVEQIPRFSTSVRDAIENLKSYTMVSSWHIVREICLIHPEYGKGLAKVIAQESSPIGVQAAPSISEWQNDIYKELKSDFSHTNIIDGRMVILALARIDRILDEYLTKPRPVDISESRESNAAKKITIQIPKKIHEQLLKKNLTKKK